MRIDIITVFPEWFDALSKVGVVGRAIQKGMVSLELWNPRDFTSDRHRTVDDRPYGGGPGMVMMTEPLERTIQAVREAGADSQIGYLSPQGQVFDQQHARRLAQRERLILLCGRYEGIDERLLETAVDEEWSIGDYVLSGGESAASVMIDAIVRLLPGVLGDERSAAQDSFMEGLLDCPHYTRPETYAGRDVPAVLLSGHHAQIERWRLKQALGRTYLRRPELLQRRGMSAAEQDLLAEFLAESGPLQSQ
ncbi:MAG: tRNA (guanosine(37)-N1)-methyltransferase TrmD [Wenzhouxiangellaceae bacterium]